MESECCLLVNSEASHGINMQSESEIERLSIHCNSLGPFVLWSRRKDIVPSFRGPGCCCTYYCCCGLSSRGLDASVVASNDRLRELES